jgi:hypothetical protein
MQKRNFKCNLNIICASKRVMHSTTENQQKRTQSTLKRPKLKIKAPSFLILPDHLPQMANINGAKAGGCTDSGEEDEDEDEWCG